MPLPFIATLTKSARLFLPFAEAGVARGLSANATITGFLRGGGQIRRTTGLEVIRRVRGVKEQSSQLQFLRRDRMPDPRRLPEALTKLARAFSFEVRLRGFDVATGEAIERFVTVSLKEPLLRRDIEQIGQQFAQPEPEPYGVVLTEVALVGGKRAGPVGTHF